MEKAGLIMFWKATETLGEDLIAAPMLAVGTRDFGASWAYKSFISCLFSVTSLFDLNLALTLG